MSLISILQSFIALFAFATIAAADQPAPYQSAYRPAYKPYQPAYKPVYKPTYQVINFLPKVIYTWQTLWGTIREYCVKQWASNLIELIVYELIFSGHNTCTL